MKTLINGKKITLFILLAAIISTGFFFGFSSNNISASDVKILQDGDKPAENEIWLDTTPSVGLDVTDALSFHFVVNSLNIIETVATTDIATGAIYYVCLWRPLTPGSTVVADGTTLSA